MTSVLPGKRMVVEPDETDDTKIDDNPADVDAGSDAAFVAEFDEAFDDLPVAGAAAVATDRPAADEGPAAVTLTDRERAMLVFERQWWRHAGSKEQAIREQFGLSATRYYQMLNALLESPAAVEFDPIVVGRLRRLRATRARRRAR